MDSECQPVVPETKEAVLECLRLLGVRSIHGQGGVWCSRDCAFSVSEHIGTARAFLLDWLAANHPPTAGDDVALQRPGATFREKAYELVEAEVRDSLGDNKRLWIDQDAYVSVLLMAGDGSGVTRSDTIIAAVDALRAKRAPAEVT